MKKITNILLLSLLITALITGCSNNPPVPQNSHSPTKKSAAATPEAVPTDEDTVQKLLEGMTLEEKAGQIFMMSLRHLHGEEPTLEFDDAAKDRLQKYHLGGVILFGENIVTIPQTKKLIDDCQASAKIPLFMAVDEEGGKVSRLNDSPKMHATKIPLNSVIGSTGNPELAKQAAEVIAEEISSLGFNMDLAPVADANTNPKNPIIGTRSFGADPQMVGEMVKAQVEGFQSRNIMAVLKHFPGHGDTSTDTHTGATIVQHDMERLKNVEFIPFQQGIDSGAAGIMSAHIQVPKVTGNDLPATMSKKFLTNILRNDMNFEGLILTDALEMGAIRKYYGSSESAIKAFEAGADILLCPFPLEDAYYGILNSAKNGRISEDRLNASVKRILTYKQRYKVLDGYKSDLDPEKTLGSKEHKAVVEEILAKAK